MCALILCVSPGNCKYSGASIFTDSASAVSVIQCLPWPGNKLKIKEINGS
jgi:hypothetical protein